MKDVKQYKKLPRLYVDAKPLAVGMEIELTDDQAHYLRNVMRLNVGDQVRIFNGHDGEFLSSAKEINKKKCLISLSNAMHEQISVPDFIVLVSPVKKDAFDLMVQKAGELGVSTFQPVICDHSVVRKVKGSRLEAISREAAEQCERLDVMRVADEMALKDVLDTWNPARKILFCLERDRATPIVDVLLKSDFQGVLPACLIGPEGGFSENEVKYIQSHDFVIPVSLGNRILKAETALISAVSCIQAICGDWR